MKMKMDGLNDEQHSIHENKEGNERQKQTKNQKLTKKKTTSEEGEESDNEKRRRRVKTVKREMLGEGERSRMLMMQGEGREEEEGIIRVFEVMTARRSGGGGDWKEVGRAMDDFQILIFLRM